MLIKISNDFSDTPGARYYKDGDNSGEEFYERILKPAFDNCIKKNEIMSVDFDDCYGFPPSFLSESFGRLSDEFGVKIVLESIQIISEQDPLIKSQVVDIIKNPRRPKNDT